jgi:DNA primase
LSATKTIKKYKQALNKKAPAKHSHLPIDEMNKYENNKEKLKIWTDEGISYDVMEKYQVRYDPVDNRIVFPIKDINGNIICTKGRTLYPDWKEKGLRKYTYKQSIGDLDFFFGHYEHLDEIKKANELILFEGEKSVMLMESWGFYNTGAILTSHLNDYILPILIKLGVRIVFALDKEIDIQKDENIKKLSRFVKVEYIYDKDKLLEPKMAPVDKGKEKWLLLYEGRRSLN